VQTCNAEFGKNKMPISQNGEVPGGNAWRIVGHSEIGRLPKNLPSAIPVQHGHCVATLHQEWGGRTPKFAARITPQPHSRFGIDRAEPQQ
jgi:hypothetical protein